MDNTSNNKSCMQELETLLRARDVAIDGPDHLVMCFPHIMHICVTHVLKSFTDSGSDVSAAWRDAFPDEVERNEYIKALRSNPITLGRNIVRIIRVSGLRRDEFMDTVKTGNIKNWFKDSAGIVERVPELELVRDVKPRWDSTHAMLNRLRALRCCHTNVDLTSQAIDYFLALPNQRELEENALSPQQWQVLKDFECILQVKPVKASLKAT